MKTKNLIHGIAITAMLAFAACKQPAGTENGGASSANIDAVKKVYAFMNEGKLDSLDAYIAADFKENNPDPMQKTPGLAGMKEMMKMYATASPDMKMSINSIMAEGDMVMVHATISGTNTGSMGPGMPATGKPWKADMYEKMRIADGKMVEHWGVFDSMAMMTQLGLMPMPGMESASAAPAAEASAKK